MSNIPLVSIVIPTYNRAEMLERLLVSIDASLYSNLEICVVNDCSTDNTLVVLEKFRKLTRSRLHVITNATNKNVTASRNIGIKYATGQYIFLIDDDNILERECISELVGILEGDRSVGMVGPVMYFFKMPNVIWWAGTIRNMTTSRTYFFGRDYPIPDTDTWATDDFPNAWMLKREIVDNGILFDESLVIHYEESDLSRRVNRILGYRLLVNKKAKIYHDVDQNDSVLVQRRWLDTRRVFYTARNRIIFHSRYSTLFQFLQFSIFWNWIFTLYYLKFIYQIPDAKLSARFKSMWAYVRGAFGGFMVK